MATKQIQPSDGLAALPNELQDMVFAMLDDESRVFDSDKRTSASALKALFAHFCRRRTLDRTSLYGHGFEAKVMPELSKLSQIHKTIVTIPSKAADVVELTLVIPVRRKVTNSRFAELVAKLPAAWHGDLLPVLFSRLSRVKKLNLLALYVPRGEHARVYGDLKHACTPSSFNPAPLPSTVRYLRVEDTECSDRLHLRAVNGVGLGECWGSNLVSRFTNFASVEDFHFNSSEGHDTEFGFLREFSSLRTIRYDHKRWTGSQMIDDLCKNLKPLQHLHTLDIRFSKKYVQWHQISSWRSILATVNTIRIPLDALLDALKPSNASHPLTLDIMLDGTLFHDAGIEGDASEPESWQSRQRSLLKGVQNLEAWLSLRREQGLDNRQIKITRCILRDDNPGWPGMLMRNVDREDFLNELRAFRADDSKDEK